MKRSSLIFTLLLVAFLMGVFFLMQQAPKKFDWSVTFHPDSPEPFGTLLVDSLLSEELPHGYRTVYKTAKDFRASSDSTRRRAILIVDAYELGLADFDNLLAMVSQGDQLLVMGVHDALYDSLRISVAKSYANPFEEIRAEIKNGEEVSLDTIRLLPEGDYPETTVRLPHSMRGGSMDMQSCPYPHQALWLDEHPRSMFAWRQLPGDEEEKSEVFYDVKLGKVDFGKGEIIVCPIDLLFTNYGILDPTQRMLLLRLLDEVKNRPLVRLVRPDTEGSYKPLAALSFIAQHPPLQHAWQLIVVLLILAMAFNARRRQRAIAIRRRSANTTLQFLRQYASLYRRQSDHGPLLQRQYRAFADELLRRWSIDIRQQEIVQRRREVDRLAQILHRSAFSVMSDLDELDRILATGAETPPNLFRQAMRSILRLTPKQSS